MTAFSLISSGIANMGTAILLLATGTLPLPQLAGFAVFLTLVLVSVNCFQEAIISLLRTYGDSN